MVSKEKRFRYDSETFFNSSDNSEDTSSNEENQNNEDPDVELNRYRSRRKPKCLSKNAQTARENRLKKKIYVARLEKEVSSLKKDNSKLSRIIDSQSFMLNGLKNEVKYLKSVLANSSDISKLLKNVHQGTGLPVSTSLNKSLRVEGDYNRRVPISRKTMHPWDEKDKPCSSTSSQVSVDNFFDDLNFEFPLNIENNFSPFLDESDMVFGLEENKDSESMIASLEEHNYTRTLALSRNLEELQIYLPMLYHRFKSLRHLLMKLKLPG